MTHSILLVGRDNTFLEATHKQCVSLGYSTTIAQKSDDLAELIGGLRPDIIFMDFDLPLPGLQSLLEYLSSSQSLSSIPIVSFVGKRGLADLDINRESHCYYIRKSSCSIKSLNAVLGELLVLPKVSS